MAASNVQIKSLEGAQVMEELYDMEGTIVAIERKLQLQRSQMEIMLDLFEGADELGKEDLAYRIKDMHTPFNIALDYFCGIEESVKDLAKDLYALLGKKDDIEGKLFRYRCVGELIASDVTDRDEVAQMAIAYLAKGKGGRYDN